MMGSLSSPSRLSASLRPRLRRGSGLDGILDRAGSRLLRDGPGAYGPQRSADQLHSTARMDDITELEVDSEHTSPTRCRELLGDEATEMSDEQPAAIRQHAQAMANVLVELFLTIDSRR